MPQGIEEHITDRRHILLTGTFDQPFLVIDG